MGFVDQESQRCLAEAAYENAIKCFFSPDSRLPTNAAPRDFPDSFTPSRSASNPVDQFLSCRKLGGCKLQDLNPSCPRLARRPHKHRCLAIATGTPQDHALLEPTAGSHRIQAPCCGSLLSATSSEVWGYLAKTRRERTATAVSAKSQGTFQVHATLVYIVWQENRPPRAERLSRSQSYWADAPDAEPLKLRKARVAVRTATTVQYGLIDP